jgi:hypothetical protein
VRAGTSSESQLIESWELVSEEQVPDAQVPAQAFDSRPPQARKVWQAVPEPALPPEPYEVTITGTLELARTPLFVFAPGGPALLTKIEAGPPEEAIPRTWFENPDDPFDMALRRALALRFTYVVTDASSMQMVRLYEGPAREFGGYLRSLARWRSSTRLSAVVAGRAIQGWQVSTYVNGLPWTVFEIDGTLIALEYTLPESLALLEQLQPLTR